MSSDSSNQKLTDGLKRLDEIEREIAAETTAAEEEVSAAQDDLAQATAKLSKIKEKQDAVTERRTSVTNFLSKSGRLRRKNGQSERLLRSVAGYDLESAKEEEDLPAEAKPAPETSPAPTTQKKRKAKEESAPAPALPPAKKAKRTQDYLEACPTIVRTADGSWVELRCSECGGNTEPQKSRFYKGLAGLQKHLQTNHQVKVARAGVIGKCMHRVVPNGEVEGIMSGEVEVEVKMGAGKGKATPAREVRGGGGGGKSRAAVLEEEEEAEVVEGEAEGEGGVVAEREEMEEVVEPVRPSDSVPATEVNRARMAQFREEIGVLFRPVEK